MFITQAVVAASDVPARYGRHAGAAAARCDGAGADGDRRRPRRIRRAASAPCSCRWASGPSHWTPATTGPGFEFSADPQADREVPRLASPSSRTSIGRCRGRTPSAPATWLTGHGAEAHRGRGLLRRDVARSDDRRPDRQGHGLPVDRNRHRESGRIRRRVRRRLQLRLHEHHLVEGADDAAADGDEPARGVRADVRPAGIAGGSRCARMRGEPQHSRFGEAATSRRSSSGLGRARSRAARRVSRPRARDRAADSAGRAPGRPTEVDGAGRADRRCRRRSRSTPA